MEHVDAEALYSDEVYAVVDNRESVFERIILREAGAVLRKAESILASSGPLSVLDFGCGKGQFLLEATRQGWKALGVETASERARFAREHYQVEVHQEHYEGGSLGADDFDLITLNHVLEHLPEPLEILEKLVSDNLRKNGLLMVEVPRLDSWQSRIAGLSWMHLDIPKHLTHWTEDGLVREMGKMGFHPVGRRSFSVHLGVLGMLQALAVRTGYRDNIIVALKRKRTPGLLLRLGLLLPVAFVFEALSVPFGRSGIMGLFFLRRESPPAP